jgi:hypothetical protein
MTLDPDVEALLRRRMRERRISFKVALNEALRSGLAGPHSSDQPFRTTTFRMGFEPTVPFDKALRLAAELEDEELIRKLASHK